MSYKWIEFLQLSEGLHSNPSSPGPEDAALRAAASRAYYAAYHLAVNFALQEGFEPTYGARDHERIRTHFRNSGTPNQIRRHISLELDRLYNHRRKADYKELPGRQTKHLASQAISMAKSILNDLASCS